MSVVTTAYIYSYTPQYRAVDPNLVEVAFTQSGDVPSYEWIETFVDYYEYINATANFMTQVSDSGLRNLFSPDAKINYTTTLSQANFQLILDAANTYFNP